MNANGEESQRGSVSRRVIGCAFRVSSELGAGFLESVYERALCIELSHEGISYERQKIFAVYYRDAEVGRYTADLIAEQCLLVELKALRAPTGEHEAQVMNYLRASGLAVGLLLNFGVPRLEVKRVVWHHDDAKRL